MSQRIMTVKTERPVCQFSDPVEGGRERLQFLPFEVDVGVGGGSQDPIGRPTAKMAEQPFPDENSVLAFAAESGSQNKSRYHCVFFFLHHMLLTYSYT